MTMKNSDMQSGATRVTGSGTTQAELERGYEGYEGTSRQRRITRVSNSTKLPGTNKVTPPLVTPLVVNGASLEEAFTRIVDSMVEQNDQMSIRMSELEKAVHVERESLREEINNNSQEITKNEKRLRGKMDSYWVRSLSPMTREADERKKKKKNG